MTYRALACLALLATFVGCSSTNVFTDRDPDVDFSEYRSFAFLAPKPLVALPPGSSPLLEGRLVEAARQDLLAKGLTESTDQAAADLIISFTLGSRERVEATQYPSYYGAGRYGWGDPYYGATEVRTYTEGVLSIDMFDPKRDAPVWHGRTTKYVTRKMRENPDEAISEAVSEVLAQFP
jgi:hypothetical protein